MKKRILAIVLLLVLVLQFVPANASAANKDVTLKIAKEYSIDGKTSYSLTKQEYKNLLSKVHKHVQDKMDDLSAGFKNISSIKVNDDCTVVTVVVKTKDLTSSEKKAESTYFKYCKKYAAYAQKKLNVLPIIYKNSDGETLWTSEAKKESTSQSSGTKSNNSGTKSNASSGTKASTKDNKKSEQMVWIPRTGKKYHSKSTCSNMKNPEKVTISEAKRRGYEKCKKCW